MSDKKPRLTITLDKDLYEKITAQAEYEDRSLSNMINKIVREYYNRGVKN